VSLDAVLLLGWEDSGCMSFFFVRWSVLAGVLLAFGVLLLFAVGPGSGVVFGQGGCSGDPSLCLSSGDSSGGLSPAGGGSQVQSVQPAPPAPVQSLGGGGDGQSSVVTGGGQSGTGSGLSFWWL